MYDFFVFYQFVMIHLSRSQHEIILSKSFHTSLECITVAKEGMRTNDRLEQCGLKFFFCLQECKSQAEHREGILKPFPASDWKADILAHANTLQNSKPSDTFVTSPKKKIYRSRSTSRFVVSKVKTAFETAQRVISVGANCLWIALDRLPSDANVSGMLLSIRKRL